MSRIFFDRCIEEAIALQDERNRVNGWRELPERTAANHLIGDYMVAVMGIGTEQAARAFYEGEVDYHRTDPTWESRYTPEEGARMNIGWVLGGGMAPERIAMWRRACEAAHPVFG